MFTRRYPKSNGLSLDVPCFFMVIWSIPDVFRRTKSILHWWNLVKSQSFDAKKSRKSPWFTAKSCEISTFHTFHRKLMTDDCFALSFLWHLQGSSFQVPWITMLCWASGLSPMTLPRSRRHIRQRGRSRRRGSDVVYNSYGSWMVI